MATQVTGRKRIPNREKLTAEEDALSQIAREAEARLAAKRAARAEAREIRMKELEKQQKEVRATARLDLPTRSVHSVQCSYNTVLLNCQASRTASTLSAATLASLGGGLSRRGSCDTSISADTEASIREMKVCECANPLCMVIFQDSLTEAEEKYRRAMVSNAQLDNEKSTLMYQVDTLRETLLELEEQLYETQRECEEKTKEYEREHHAHTVLQFQFSEMKNTLQQTEELLKDAQLRRVKGESCVREISDLQETLEWKEKKIRALERQKEYSDIIRDERNALRDEVFRLRDALKKHGIVLGPEVSTNGESGGGLVEPPEDVDSASSLPHNLQTSIITGDSMLGKIKTGLVLPLLHDETLFLLPGDCFHSFSATISLKNFFVAFKCLPNDVPERPAEDQDPGLDSTTGRSSSPSLESVFQEEDQRSAAEDADTGTVRSAKAAGFVAQALVEFHQSNNDAVVQIQAIQPSEISDGTKVEQLLRADCGPEACSGRLENHEEQNTKQLVSVYLMQVVDDIHMDCTKHSRTETVQGGVSDRQNQGDALSNESRSGNEWKRGKVDLALALEHLLQEEGGALEHLLQEEGGALEHLLQEQGGALEHLLQEEGGALEHLLQEEGGALEHLVQEEGGALEHLLQEEGGALEHLVQKEGGALEAIKAPDNQTKKTTHLNENIKEALGAQQNNSQPVESYLPESASIPQKKHCDEGTAKEMKRARLNRRGQEVIKAPNVPEVERTSTLRETHPLTQQCVTEPAHETLSMSVREEKGFALFLDSCQEAGALDFEVFTREQEDKPSAETQKEADTTGNKVKSTRVKPRTDNTHDCCVS
uniref:Leucine-rich repeat flightless-interacting protein 1-like n=1 Tax=Electrophorus electricus TaxID=8005 RepID=A0AAY5EVS2_ELEEL